MSPANSSATALPLVDVLRQISIELTTIADMVNVIEESVLNGKTSSAATDHCNMRDMQGIDLIGQSLKALAGFSESLSEIMPLEWHVDAGRAAHGLLLTDLARRLSQVQHHPGWVNVAAAGEWEMFD